MRFFVNMECPVSPQFTLMFMENYPPTPRCQGQIGTSPSLYMFTKYHVLDHEFLEEK